MYTVTVNGNIHWQSAQIVDGADQLLIAGSEYLQYMEVVKEVAWRYTVILALDGAIIRHSTRDRTQTMWKGAR